MTVRVLTPDYAEQCDAMINTALPKIQEYWPGPVASVGINGWEAVLKSCVGRGHFASEKATELQGFIVCREAWPPDEPQPEGETAEELFVWLIPDTVSERDLAAWTNELAVHWWTDLQRRGVTWGWGYHAAQYPARTEKVIDAHRAAGGIYEDREHKGRQMRRVKMTPADALAVYSRL